MVGIGEEVRWVWGLGWVGDKDEIGEEIGVFLGLGWVW